MILKRINFNEKESKKYLEQDKKVKEKFIDNGVLKYISDYAKFPVTDNNDVSYYPLGDKAFPVMVEELKKAKKFIFMEYFIFTPGTMWNTILEVLEEKRKMGSTPPGPL